MWYETWYQELPETDQYNITCLEKFLDFVYDEAEKQGIDSCHNYNINPNKERNNESTFISDIVINESNVKINGIELTDKANIVSESLDFKSAFIRDLKSENNIKNN